MKRAICAAALLAACIEPPKTKATTGGPIVLGLAPTTDVATTEAVRIGFSEEVNSGSIHVARRDGRPVPFTSMVTTSGDELMVAPAPEWPEGETLIVTISSGFDTPDGRPLVPPTQALSFTTKVDGVPSPRPVVRAPTPGEAAPVNLRWIAVASSPALPMPLGEVYLEGTAGRVALEVVQAREETVLLEVQEPLTQASTYQVVIPHAEVATADPALTVVRTSTSFDTVPPTVTSTRVMIEGDQLLVDVDANEPIVASGTAVDEAGRTVKLVSRPMVARQARLTSAGAIAGGAQLAVYVEVRDLAGNIAPPIRLELGFPPATRAHISELVPTALHDWSDSSGGAVPFDDRPGTGSITSTDEWVEIVNDSDEPVSVLSAGLELRTIDQTPSITRIDGAPALYFGDGGNLRAWWPGEAMVVRTRGDMAQRNLTVELWSGTTLLDRVTLGDGPQADHPGGSPVDTWHESIARDADGRLHWCVPTPGNPVPPPDCLD